MTNVKETFRGTSRLHMTRVRVAYACVLTASVPGAASETPDAFVPSPDGKKLIEWGYDRPADTCLLDELASMEWSAVPMQWKNMEQAARNFASLQPKLVLVHCPAVEQVVLIRRADRRLIGWGAQDQWFKPVIVLLERRPVPVGRPQAGVEDLLQRAQEEPLVLAGRMGAVQHYPPTRVRIYMLTGPILVFDPKREDQAWFARAPGSVPPAVIKHLAADRIVTCLQPSRYVQRVRFKVPGVARAWSPQHAFAVDAETVATVG